MADDNTSHEEGTTQTGSADQSGQERTYTQSEVDSMLDNMLTQEQFSKAVSIERKKERAKFDGYDKYKADAEAHADYDEVAAARDAAQSELETLRAQIAHRDLVDKVSAETGVPGSLLKGETEEELTASAEAVAAFANAKAMASTPAEPTYPEDKGGGANPAPITREQIMAEPDTQRRQALIAEHLDLFR